MASSDITVLTHTDGFLLLSQPATIEAFVAENKLEGIVPTPGVLGAIGSLIQATAVVSANSGRWIPLADNSLKLLRQFGPSLNSTTGLMTGVVRAANGAIAGHLEFIPLPGMINPPAAAPLGLLMTQLSHQRQLDEMTTYLREISADVKDLLDDQVHRATAELAGIALTLEEVQTILEATGRVDEVLWTKLHGASSTLATTQAYALKKLEAAATSLRKAAGSSELGDDEAAMSKFRDACASWLTLLTHSILLGDTLAQLELEREKDAGLEQLQEYLTGLEAARTKRTERISGALESILDAATDVAAAAQSKRLTRPRRVANITASNNEIHHQLGRFARAVGIQNPRCEAIENPAYLSYASTRIKGLANAAVAKGRDVVTEAAQLPGRAADAKDDFILQRADRIRAKHADGNGEKAAELES